MRPLGSITYTVSSWATSVAPAMTATWYVAHTAWSSAWLPSSQCQPGRQVTCDTNVLTSAADRPGATLTTSRTGLTLAGRLDSTGPSCWAMMGTSAGDWGTMK